LQSFHAGGGGNVREDAKSYLMATVRWTAVHGTSQRGSPRVWVRSISAKQNKIVDFGWMRSRTLIRRDLSSEQSLVKPLVATSLAKRPTVLARYKNGL